MMEEYVKICKVFITRPNGKLFIIDCEAIRINETCTGTVKKHE